jgi:hypothetical protein
MVKQLRLRCLASLGLEATLLSALSDHWLKPRLVHRGIQGVDPKCGAQHDDEERLMGHGGPDAGDGDKALGEEIAHRMCMPF